MSGADGERHRIDTCDSVTCGDPTHTRKHFEQHDTFLVLIFVLARFSTQQISQGLLFLCLHI